MLRPLSLRSARMKKASRRRQTRQHEATNLCTFSGKSGPNTTILRLHTGARLTRYRNCKFHNFARTISRHADGISRYSVPPSAGSLLPLCTFVPESGDKWKIIFKEKNKTLQLLNKRIVAYFMNTNDFGLSMTRCPLARSQYLRNTCTISGCFSSSLS